MKSESNAEPLLMLAEEDVAPADAPVPASGVPAVTEIFSEEVSIGAAPPSLGSEAGVPVAAVSFDFTKKWPASLPNVGGALRALTGSLPVPLPLAEMTEAFQTGLSPTEKAVLSGDDSAVSDGELLRLAVVTRWRIESAIALKPEPNQAIETQAFEVLLADIDGVIARLREAEAASDAHKEVFEKTRGALITGAVNLAELIQQTTQNEALAAAATATKKYEKSVVGTRMRSIDHVSAEEVSKAGVRQKAMVAALVVVVLLVGAYHGRALVKRPPPAQPAPISVGGASVAGNVKKGPMVVRSRDGNPLSQEAEEAVRNQAAQLGRSIYRLSPSEILILPEGARAPSTPGNP